MRRLSIAVLLVLILGVTVSPRPAEALGLELEGRVWAPSFSGRGSLQDLGDLPPEIGLPPELELDLGGLLAVEADEVYEIRGTFRIALGFYLRGTYQKMNNRGSNEITLDDLDLPIPLPPIELDATVDSLLDFEYGRVALGWRFVAPDQFFSLGAFVEAKGVRGDAAIAVDSLFFSDSAEEDFAGGAGSWGVTGEINPSEKWKIFGEFSTAFGDDEVDMIDWEVGGRFYPTDVFGIGLGYRAMDLEGVIDDVPLDGGWKGAFLTAILEF
jgi:hypothetical protein